MKQNSLDTPLRPTLILLAFVVLFGFSQAFADKIVGKEMVEPDWQYHALYGAASTDNRLDGHVSKTTSLMDTFSQSGWEFAGLVANANVRKNDAPGAPAGSNSVFLMKRNKKWILLRGRNEVKEQNALVAQSAEDNDVLLDRAWLLAAFPYREVRDPSQAIKDAKQVCTQTKWKESWAVAVLAAAYAASGDFEKAVETNDKALEIVRDTSFDDKESKRNYLKSLGGKGSRYADGFSLQDWDLIPNY